MQTILRRLSIAFFTALLLAGCATTAQPQDDADPLQSYNRAMFTFNEAVDKAVFKPVALAYQTVLPDPVIASVGNFFSNLNDVVVLLNDLLQFKLHQAAMDSSRIAFNTTFGLFGLFDVATAMQLPKHNEDFGQTLGFWGVDEGYYIVLPFFGPSTVRDTFGFIADSFTDPVTWGVESDTAQWSLWSLNFINQRAGLLRVERTFAGAEIDPYTFRRSAYLQQRRNLVHDGNPPRPTLDFAPEPNKPTP